MSETYTITAGTHDYTASIVDGSSSTDFNSTILSAHAEYHYVEFPPEEYSVDRNVYVEIDTSSIGEQVIQEGSATFNLYSESHSLVGVTAAWQMYSRKGPAGDPWGTTFTSSTSNPPVGQWMSITLDEDRINKTGLTSFYINCTAVPSGPSTRSRKWNIRSYENTTGGESQGYWSPYIEATLESGVVKKYILVRHVS